MLIAIVGENCSGKSTLAKALAVQFSGEIVSGKDWLRMAKSELEALSLFRKKLQDAVCGADLFYVISEAEPLAWLPEGTVRILVTADLETIKQRFRARLHGNLPAPVERMLEQKHGMFDGGQYDSASTVCMAMHKACAPQSWKGWKNESISFHNSFGGKERFPRGGSPGPGSLLERLPSGVQ